MKRTLSMGADDDVVLALQRLKPGSQLGGVEVLDTVEPGHKLAVRAVRAGRPVRFYDGVSIGIATQNIYPGCHVHLHNLRSAVSWKFSPWKEPDFSQWKPRVQVDRSWFNGFVRNIADERRVGIRNDLWIIPAVSCTRRQCEQLAKWGREVIDARPEYACITGIHVLAHSFGCSEGERALKRLTQPSLLGHVANPNAGAVLSVGLGCEENSDFFEVAAAAGLANPRRFKHFTLQSYDSSQYADPLEHGRALVQSLLEEAAQARRESCHVRELTIGVKCGASGPFSGITGNPILGAVADLLVAQGATLLITEVPEFFGAIEAVLGRAVSKQVYDQLVHQFLRYRDQLEADGIEVTSNPSPGNIAAGLTTNEQKSLGAVKKAGSGPVVGFVDYGQRVPPAQGGVVIIYGPGGDETAITTLQASGAVMIPWVTQAGTPLGSYSPTPKIFATSEGARRFPSWCDFDAGVLLQSGVHFEDVVTGLYHTLLDIAEGRPAQHELSDSRGMNIWSKISL